MSPHRSLSISSTRRPSQLQDVFIGIAFQLAPQPVIKGGQEDKGRDLEYSVVLHDGTGVTDSETFHFQYHTHDLDADEQGEEAKKFTSEMLGVMRKIQSEKSLKVSVCSKRNLCKPPPFLRMIVSVVTVVDIPSDLPHRHCPACPG